MFQKFIRNLKSEVLEKNNYAWPTDTASKAPPDSRIIKLYDLATDALIIVYTILIVERVLSGEYSCVGWIYLIASLIIAPW